MKGALIALFIGLSLLVFIYFKMNVYRTKGSFDFHLHDTYYVLSYSSAIALGLLLLGTFFSVGGLIGTLFRSKLFCVFALVFISVDAYCLACFYKAFNETKPAQFPKD